MLLLSSLRIQGHTFASTANFSGILEVFSRAITINTGSMGFWRLILVLCIASIRLQFGPPAASAGLGLGYSELVEFYFRYESIGLMHLMNGLDEFTGYSLTKALKLRVYPFRGLYIGASYGWLNASTDSLYLSPPHILVSTVGPSTKTSFHTWAFSIGYSGKWTFAEFEQSFGIPHHVMFGSQSIDYSFWIVRFGVNVRVF